MRLDQSALPILEVQRDDEGGVSYKSLLGTGFRLGDSNRFLTCAHVIDRQEYVIGFIHDDGWVALESEVLSVHQELDIAILEIRMDHLPPSPFVISRSNPNSALDYHCWGYPADHLHDYGILNSDGITSQVPELIFTKGYVRRRFSHTLPGLRGAQFIELSEVAGNGCSGAPIIQIKTPYQKPPIHTVIGIYTGERVISEMNEDGMLVAKQRLGYATRLDGVFEWLERHEVLSDSAPKPR